ncbi:MAG: tRNA (adenosine(37)-N6)-threonylcarbamoyltransferase complex ATPase subunit type 1 TsaE [Flavobacteriales bacterium]|nr:tRNA (adenosine(37)-N6)-threonylcarbamoyltransferase complex ATPase subunit type 1 TsaE [Flavobacteriales bacterium]
MKLELSSLDELSETVKAFLSLANDYKKFAFYGEMGVGKTTFINEVMKQMGVEDHTSSPTFSIINEYFSVNYGSIYHFDFYRLNDEMEAYDIGVEEILDSDSYCFMEWPEKVSNLLPENCVDVIISLKDTKRIIDIQT